MSSSIRRAIHPTASSFHLFIFQRALGRTGYIHFLIAMLKFSIHRSISVTDAEEFFDILCARLAANSHTDVKGVNLRFSNNNPARTSANVLSRFSQRSSSNINRMESWFKVNVLKTLTQTSNVRITKKNLLKTWIHLQLDFQGKNNATKVHSKALYSKEAEYIISKHWRLKAWWQVRWEEGVTR